MLVQAPPLDVWTNVYRRFFSLPPYWSRRHYGVSDVGYLYDLIAAGQQADELFTRFLSFLEKLKTGEAEYVLRQFAFYMPTQNPIANGVLWKWTNY